MNTRNVWIMARKELSGINYEKTIIFAILLQLFVAMFSSFLMVGLTSMYDPSSVSQYSRFRYSIAYSGTNSTLLDRLTASDDFTVYVMDLSPALESLKERKLAAVIYAPGTLPDAQDPVQITFYTLQNDLQATVVGVKLKDVFLGYESDLRTARASRITAQPIEVKFPPAARTEGFYEFVFGLLIPLLVFMPAIISASLIIDLITEEYQHETLETLVSTPITFPEMVWGKVLACEILIPAALGGQFTAKNAGAIRARLIVEGANGPTTAEADHRLREREIFIVPDILANAGGVIVSYFEWVQNIQGYYWDEEEVNQRLHRIITKAFRQVAQVAERDKLPMRKAAGVVAVQRVVDAVKALPRRSGRPAGRQPC